MNSRYSILLAMSAVVLIGCSGNSKSDESPARKAGTPEHVAASTSKDNSDRKGAIANDFRYVDREGNESTLHSIKTPHTILIFYNPECPHCAPLLKKKAANRRLNSAIAKGELTILAVYAEGDLDVWEKTKDDMPVNWIVGYDLTGVLERDLYDLSVMPIGYALSANKRILYKDIPW